MMNMDSERKREGIRTQIHIFLKNSLSFLVGSSVDSHFIFHMSSCHHPYVIILVHTFINVPFISSWISSKPHVYGSLFRTFQSVCSVFVFFEHIFFVYFFPEEQTNASLGWHQKCSFLLPLVPVCSLMCNFKQRAANRAGESYVVGQQRDVR